MRHKQLSWREALPPEGVGSNAYKQIVPSGNLPALLINPDTPTEWLLTDSESINEYLEAAFPTISMLPTALNKAALVRDISRFHDTRLEPALRLLFGQIGLDPLQRDTALIDQQTEQLTLRLQQLAWRLHSAQHDPTEALQLCDTGYPITFAWIDLLLSELDRSVVWPEHITQYRRNLASINAVAHELQAYTPAMLEWLEMKRQSRNNSRA